MATEGELLSTRSLKTSSPHHSPGCSVLSLTLRNNEFAPSWAVEVRGKMSAAQSCWLGRHRGPGLPLMWCVHLNRERLQFTLQRREVATQGQLSVWRQIPKNPHSASRQGDGKKEVAGTSRSSPSLLALLQVRCCYKPLELLLVPIR